MQLSKITRSAFRGLSKVHHWVLHLDCKKADRATVAAFRRAQRQLELVREAKSTLELMQLQALEIELKGDKAWDAAVSEMEAIKRALND